MLSQLNSELFRSSAMLVRSDGQIVSLSKSYLRLVNQLVNDVLQKIPPTNKHILIDGGHFEIEPMLVRTRLESQIKDLVMSKTAGIGCGSEEEWRIKVLARQFLSAFMTNTLVKSVEMSSYLGFCALSLDFAKNPELIGHLIIQSGFGGSAVGH